MNKEIQASPGHIEHVEISLEDLFVDEEDPVTERLPSPSSKARVLAKLDRGALLRGVSLRLVVASALGLALLAAGLVGLRRRWFSSGFARFGFGG